MIGEQELQVLSASQESKAEEAAVELSGYETMTAEDAANMARLCLFGSDLVSLIDEANAGAIAEQQQREADEEQQREEEALAEKAKWEERKELLLMEATGEKVRIRHRGYKTNGTAMLEVINRGSEEEPHYVPRLRWDVAQNQSRPQNIEHWQRFEVKTPKGWKLLWDDGKDDLPEYDRNIKEPKARPHNG
jgi:hypothetical protein